MYIVLCVQLFAEDLRPNFSYNIEEENHVLSGIKPTNSRELLDHDKKKKKK